MQSPLSGCLLNDCMNEQRIAILVAAQKNPMQFGHQKDFTDVQPVQNLSLISALWSAEGTHVFGPLFEDFEASYAVGFFNF